MGLDDLFNTKRSLVRSRTRQVRIGDLLFAVVMTALGLSALNAGDLAGRERLFLGLFALSFFALVGAQWRSLACSTSERDPLSIRASAFYQRSWLYRCSLAWFSWESSSLM